MLKILVSPGELALKGRNRGFFERQLDRNLRIVFGKKLYSQERYGARRMLQINSSPTIAKSLLKNVFGISRFAVVHEAKNWHELQKRLEKALKNHSFRTFAVRGNNKTGKGLSGQDINEKLGDFICQKFSAKVDLGNPELTIYIDHYPQIFYFYFNWQRGAGGLPVGISGRVLMLFSGGIDSPVAAYLLARRGCRVDFLHFYALNSSQEVLKTKIAPLIKLLQSYTLYSKLILLPYSPFYQAIRQRPANGNEVILFRRFILRAAEQLSTENSYQALATGDNLSQVASQTLDNIAATTEAVSTLVFRPLIGFDKVEIIAWARKIGSYELSIKPYQDCCALVQKHARTRVNLAAIINEEKKLKLNDILKTTLGQKKIIKL